MTRNNVFVGDRRVLRRYIGDKLIFDDLSDKTEILSGTEIFTDKADEGAVVHVGVDGKSYQHAGSGKNLINSLSFKDYPVHPTYPGSNHVELKLKPNTQYTLSTNVPISPGGSNLIYFNGTLTANVVSNLSPKTTTTDGEGNFFILTFKNRPNGNLLYDGTYWVQLEEGSTATEYEPPIQSPDYPIELHSLNDFDVVSSVGRENLITLDKINLLLDEPLRSVGDVKDRLFRDTDGLWKVERNVGEVTLDGIEGWVFRGYALNGLFVYNIDPFANGDFLNDARALSSHFEYLGAGGLGVFSNSSKVGFGLYDRPQNNPFANLYLVSNQDNTTDLKAWLGDNNVTVHYQKFTSTIETLEQELQDKLNNLGTFKDSNYVYTVLPNESNIIQENLKPTLHATFKSIGWETFRNKVIKESEEM